MKDENKIRPVQGEKNSSTRPGEDKTPAKARSGFLARKWVFPAAYLAAAAIILTLMWMYQNSANSPTDETQLNLEVTGEAVPEGEEPDAVAAAAEAETLGWPVADRSSLEVTLGFFDVNNTNEDNQAAMVEYGDTFTPHYGIDLASPNNEAFDVLAAMSGTVVRVEQVPVIGNLVEIEHKNGLSTVYTSVEDLRVAKGDEVRQGDVIAKSGRNELEKELGNHVHFEVWEDGHPVNPEDYIGQ